MNPPAGAMPFNVTVAIVDCPAETFGVLRLNAVRDGGFTVSSSSTDAPGALALMRVIDLVATASVDTGTVAVVAPAATSTLGLTFADPSAVRETLNPPFGAGPLRVIVPVGDTPPTTLVELRTKVAICGDSTVKVAAAFEPSIVAVTSAWVISPTGVVVKANVADVAPAGIITEEGPPQAGELALRETVSPLAGAAESSLRVAVAPAPPTTLVGINESSASLGASTTSVVELLLVPRVALIVTVAESATGVVAAVKFTVVWPLGMVMLGGMVTIGLLDVIVTTTPAGPAFAVSSTVPADVAPPATDGTDRETFDNFCAPAIAHRLRTATAVETFKYAFI